MPIRLYDFNGSTGTVCEIFLPVQMVNAESANAFSLRAAFRADATPGNVRGKLFANGSSTAAYDSGDVALSRAGQQVLDFSPRPNVRNAKTLQAYFKITGVGGNDCGPDYVEAQGEYSGVVLKGVAA